MSEYSYFRAAGVSLAAVEAVEKNLNDAERLRLEMARKTGAASVKLTADFNVVHYVFSLGIGVPDGWEKVADQYYRPAAGTADHFNMQAQCRRGARLLRHASLENFFGLPDMPPREVPPGCCSSRFVRDCTWYGQFMAYIGAPRLPSTHGQYKQRAEIDCSAMYPSKLPDPVQQLKYDGVWYIRVPNDEQGNARWQPPEAVPVSYAEMQAVDLAFYQKQHGPQAQPSRFGVTP